MAISINSVASNIGRPLTSAEQTQVGVWIEDAQLIIKAGPDGRGNIDLATLNQANLDYVIREAVSERIKRPDAAKQVSLSVDDGQVSKTYEYGLGRILILPEWWALLLPEVNTSAFSIRTLGGLNVAGC